MDRSDQCRSITNAVTESRLSSTIEYRDGATEHMDFELFELEALADRLLAQGFRVLELWCSWAEARPASGTEQRFQIVAEHL